MKIDQLQTPCYVIDEKKMRENLEILKKVQEDQKELVEAIGKLDA